MYKFTVFTPCYNSENIIKRVFDSLQEQTFKDFEWIVIDDCSKDKTREIIEELIPQANFPVNYIKNTTNQMETKNYEIALEVTKGEFFIKLSHDDYLDKESLNNYNNCWEKLNVEEKQKISGIILLCLDKNGKIEGDKFPSDFWISNNFQMRFKYKIKGEKCSAQKTEIIKKYPYYYPDIDIYVPADLHDFKINFDYNMLYANLIGRIHIVNDGNHQHMEHIIKTEQKYSNGFAFYYEHLINKFHSKIWKYDRKAYLFFMINYVRYSRYAGKSYSTIISNVKVHHWLVYPSIILGNINQIWKFKTLL